MSKRKTTRQASRAAAEASAPAVPGAGGPPGRAVALARQACLPLLMIATTATALIVLKHFGGRLPGCGGQSDCDALEAGPWGQVPGIGWPTSFLGLSWFLGLSVAWVTARGLPRAPLPWLARVGAAASLVLVGVMVMERKFCPYCAAAHAANLLFVALVELMTRRTSLGHAVARAPLAAGAIAFVLASAGLAVAEQRHQAARAQGAADEAAAFVVEAVRKASEDVTPASADRWGAGGFTGRHRTGPAVAPVRIVMYTDYQCPDCKRFETEAFSLLAAHPEVSLSVKHFPMCSDCNPAVTRTLHPNACAAARAAEAAAILGGDEAFFRMHRWLFSVDGRFETDAELDAGIVVAGLEPAAFRAVMNGPETLRRVQEDADEAMALGLHYTPMIFINGVELKWTIDAAATLPRAVSDLVARRLPASGPENDRPPLAAAKYVADWREQPAAALPADQPAWATLLGPETGRPVDVVMFGDYASTYTTEMEADIRRAAGDADVTVRYVYRHYPVNRDCNAALPSNLAQGIAKPLACRMARAAEAAGRVGGREAYWGMHQWLLATQAAYSDEAARAQAAQLGLDAGAFRTAMDSADAAAAIANDCEAARQVGLKSVPTLYVAGRRVPRPSLKGADVLGDILRAAAAAPR